MRVKICGITNIDDAMVAARSGADAVGLVFYKKSARNLEDLALARDIAFCVGPFVTVVGLFVNPKADVVEQVLTNVPLSVLQFHGDESASFCTQFHRPYIKALRMRENFDVLAAMAEYESASGILLDAYKKGVPGGTGESFDWAKVPLAPPKPLILAGGLSPVNVARAVAATEPYAVDVSGGVEVRPGKKDKAKIEAFIVNAQVEQTSE